MKLKFPFFLLLFLMLLVNCTSNDFENPKTDPVDEQQPVAQQKAPFSVSLLSNHDSNGNALNEYYLINLNSDGTDFEAPINLDALLQIQTEDYYFASQQFLRGEIMFSQNEQLPTSAKYIHLQNLNDIKTIEINDPDFLNTGILSVHQDRYIKKKFNNVSPPFFTFSIYSSDDMLIAELPEEYGIGPDYTDYFFDGKLFIVHVKNNRQVLDIVNLDDGSLVRSFDNIDDYSCILANENYFLAREAGIDTPLKIFDYNSGVVVKTVSETFEAVCQDYLSTSNFTLDKLPSKIGQPFQGNFIGLPSIYYTNTNINQPFNLKPLSELYNENITPLARYINLAREVLVLCFGYSLENTTELRFGVAYINMDGEILFVADDLSFRPNSITSR